ncbi:YaeQ family protein [bacterium]|nr:YaeQ family protein [bacterium]MBU3956615.1 YaeQ family protein [bacterium]MBU4134213.1 YaeQ family protein [bacterium]
MKENYIFSGSGKKIVVEKKRAQTRSRVILKLLAHEMFSGKLSFSNKQGFTFKPDLYGPASGGEKALWVECGEPSEKKIMFFRSRRDIFSVFVFLQGKDSAEAMKKLFKKHSVDAVIYAFDSGFIQKLAGALYRKNSFKCVFSRGRVKVSLNGSEYDSPVYSNILGVL